MFFTDRVVISRRLRPDIDGVVLDKCLFFLWLIASYLDSIVHRVVEVVSGVAHLNASGLLDRWKHSWVLQMVISMQVLFNCRHACAVVEQAIFLIWTRIFPAGVVWCNSWGFVPSHAAAEGTLVNFDFFARCNLLTVGSIVQVHESLLTSFVFDNLGVSQHGVWIHTLDGFLNYKSF